jgi:hypothetical protein
LTGVVVRKSIAISEEATMDSADVQASESVSDYEDLSGMALDDAQLADLIGAGGECVFTWVTRTGDPMGVVVSYLAQRLRA